jgi:hypothetical protein
MVRQNCHIEVRRFADWIGPGTRVAPPHRLATVAPGAQNIDQHLISIVNILFLIASPAQALTIAPAGRGERVGQDLPRKTILQPPWEFAFASLGMKQLVLNLPARLLISLTSHLPTVLTAAKVSPPGIPMLLDVGRNAPGAGTPGKIGKPEYPA